MEIYTYILIKKSGEYLGWSKHPTEPFCGDPDKLEWIEWNKELPEDIEEKTYILNSETMELESE